MFKKWDVDLLGMLATDQYVEEKTGKSKSVFVNNQNSIQFNMRLVSQPPANFPNQTLFHGFSSDIEPYGFTEHYASPENVRRDSVEDFFQQNLVIFRPHRKSVNGVDNYKITDVRKVKKPAGFTEHNIYSPVPVFSTDTPEGPDSFQMFLKKLWDERYVGRIEGISTEEDDVPPFIIWREDEEHYLLIGLFEKHRHAYGGFSYLFDELRVAPFREEWFEDTVMVPSEDILFVGDATFRKIEELLADTPALPNDRIVDPYTLGADGPPAPAAVESPVAVREPASAPLAVAPITEPDGTAPSVQPELAKPTGAEGRSEEDFLHELVQTARDRGLLYSERDLLNFHTAMKSSTLVILAGMSGTGKSRLVEVYGGALGLAHDTQLRIIPVRPSWTDDADLIGYVDSIHNVYRPGDSGLIDILRNAAHEQNRDKLYIVVFDEMNLARVEHYFSQFLSVLEMPQSRRKLHLYNEALVGRLYNSAEFPPELLIGDNVMFVGTVNLDESTYHFSDKVLDRANVLSLEVLPFHLLKELKEKHVKKSDQQSKTPWALKEFRQFKNPDESVLLTDREIEFFEQLHLTLDQVRGQGIGHRIVRQIDTYLKNLPDSDALPRRTAFDLQLVQRVLTKLRGPQEQLTPLIGTYQENADPTNSSLLRLLSDFSDLSDFVQTRRVILQKAKELKLNGYTL